MALCRFRPWHQKDKCNEENEREQCRNPHEDASEVIENPENKYHQCDQPIVNDTSFEYRDIMNGVLASIPVCSPERNNDCAKQPEEEGVIGCGYA